MTKNNWSFLRHGLYPWPQKVKTNQFYSSIVVREYFIWMLWPFPIYDGFVSTWIVRWPENWIELNWKEKSWYTSRVWQSIEGKPMLVSPWWCLTLGRWGIDSEMMPYPQSKGMVPDNWMRQKSMKISFRFRWKFV